MEKWDNRHKKIMLPSKSRLINAGQYQSISIFLLGQHLNILIK